MCHEVTVEMSPEFWMGIQNDYDMESVKDNQKIYSHIEKIQPLTNNMLHA